MGSNVDALRSRVEVLERVGLVVFRSICWSFQLIVSSVRKCVDRVWNNLSERSDSLIRELTSTLIERVRRSRSSMLS